MQEVKKMQEGCGKLVAKWLELIRYDFRMD